MLRILHADAPTWRAGLDAHRSSEQCRRQALQHRVADERRKATRLMAALERGVNLPSLHERVRKRDAAIASIESELQELSRFPAKLPHASHELLDEYVGRLVAQVANSD